MELEMAGERVRSTPYRLPLLWRTKKLSVKSWSLSQRSTLIRLPLVRRLFPFLRQQFGTWEVSYLVSSSILPM